MLALCAAAVAAGDDMITTLAWMGGSNEPCGEAHAPRCAGNYSGSAPWPGARCCAHVWSDAHGTAYVFGGYGYDAAGNSGYLSDLWALDMKTARWRWVGGSTVANQPNAPQWPGGRHYAAYAHDRHGGGFYLFSGQGVAGDAFLEDWWRLDLKTMSWALLGNVSAAAIGSAPVPRKWASFWSGDDGLYVLGGVVATTPAGGSLNDFWSFEYASHTWRRIYDRSNDTYGHYDAARPQWPGARHNAFTTTAADGQLWMFGGGGCGVSACGVVSDVWRWNHSAWHFVGGDPGGVEVEGVCSARGTVSAAARPTARHAGFNFDFPSPTGKMLLLGGEHQHEDLVLNDLWSHELRDGGGFAYEAGECNVPNVSSATTRGRGVAGADVAPASVYSGNGWSDQLTRTSWAFGGGPRSGYVSGLWRVRW